MSTSDPKVCSTSFEQIAKTGVQQGNYDGTFLIQEVCTELDQLAENQPTEVRLAAIQKLCILARDCTPEERMANLQSLLEHLIPHLYLDLKDIGKVLALLWSSGNQLTSEKLIIEIGLKSEVPDVRAKSLVEVSRWIQINRGRFRFGRFTLIVCSLLRDEHHQVRLNAYKLLCQYFKSAKPTDTADLFRKLAECEIKPELVEKIRQNVLVKLTDSELDQMQLETSREVGLRVNKTRSVSGGSNRKVSNPRSSSLASKASSDKESASAGFISSGVDYELTPAEEINCESVMGRFAEFYELFLEKESEYNWERKHNAVSLLRQYAQSLDQENLEQLEALRELFPVVAPISLTARTKLANNVLQLFGDCSMLFTDWATTCALLVFIPPVCRVASGVKKITATVALSVITAYICHITACDFPKELVQSVLREFQSTKPPARLAGAKWMRALLVTAYQNGAHLDLYFDEFKRVLKSKVQDANSDVRTCAREALFAATACWPVLAKSVFNELPDSAQKTFLKQYPQSFVRQNNQFVIGVCPEVSPKPDIMGPKASKRRRRSSTAGLEQGVHNLSMHEVPKDSPSEEDVINDGNQGVGAKPRTSTGTGTIAKPTTDHKPPNHSLNPSNLESHEDHQIQHKHVNGHDHSVVPEDMSIDLGQPEKETSRPQAQIVFDSPPAAAGDSLSPIAVTPEEQVSASSSSVIPEPTDIPNMSDYNPTLDTPSLPQIDSSSGLPKASPKACSSPRKPQAQPQPQHEPQPESRAYTDIRQLAEFDLNEAQIASTIKLILNDKVVKDVYELYEVIQQCIPPSGEHAERYAKISEIAKKLQPGPAPSSSNMSTNSAPLPSHLSSQSQEDFKPEPKLKPAKPESSWYPDSDIDAQMKIGAGLTAIEECVPDEDPLKMFAVMLHKLNNPKKAERDPYLHYLTSKSYERDIAEFLPQYLTSSKTIEVRLQALVLAYELYKYIGINEKNMFFIFLQAASKNTRSAQRPIATLFSPAISDSVLENFQGGSVEQKVFCVQVAGFICSHTEPDVFDKFIKLFIESTNSNSHADVRAYSFKALKDVYDASNESYNRIVSQLEEGRRRLADCYIPRN